MASKAKRDLRARIVESLTDMGDTARGYGQGAVEAVKDFDAYMKGSTPEERREAVARAIRSGGEALARYGVDISNLALSGGPDKAAKKVVWDTVNPIPAIEAARNTLAQAKRSGGADDWKMATIAALGVAGAVTPGGRRAGSLTREAAGGAEAVARSPKRGILSTPDLRNMDRQEASEVARAEPHLIPTKDGFVGGPAGVASEADIREMRARFDADVKAGAAGGDWYERAMAHIREVAGPDPERQRLLAREYALWSAQADPDTNMNFALQGHNAYQAGKPLSTVRTPQQALTYNRARDGGYDIPLGPKTGIYGDHLDPTAPSPTTGTNDIWHARGFGYTNTGGKEFSRALTAQEHRFLDYETILAMNRANEAGLDGRSDWTAAEVQAAPWVAGKGRKLAQTRGLTEEEGIALASKTYPDHVDKYTAFGTHEATPGIMTGHLPELVGSDFATRADYAARAGWASPSGRDMVYDALGMNQRPVQSATGVYTPPGGELEVNPATVARPLVGVTNGGVDPASRGMLDAAEAFRAYFDAQGAGAWHKPILNLPPGKMGSVFVPHDGPLTIEQITALQAATGGDRGLGDVVDTGQGATISNFYPGPPGGAVTGKNLRGEMGRDIASILPGRQARAHVDSGYLGYEDDWSQGVNSGAVTDRMFGYVDNPNAPAAMGHLDTPELRAKIMAHADLDDEIARSTGQPVREDVQRARRAFGRGGWGALRLLRQQGLAPSVILPLLGAGALLQQQEEEEPGRVPGV